jgi:hypothetical protein
VKHDFTSSGKSLDRIGDAHGTTAQTIRHYARLGGWVREVPTVPLRRGPKPRPPGTPKPTAAQRRTQKLIARLLAALDKGLSQLEARMMAETASGAAPVSAADVERTARSMSSMTQLLQKLVALDEEARGLGQEASQATEATEDADELRRVLALRLERLHQARNPS